MWKNRKEKGTNILKQVSYHVKRNLKVKKREKGPKLEKKNLCMAFIPYATYGCVNVYCTRYRKEPALRISVGVEAIQTLLQWVSCNYTT